MAIKIAAMSDLHGHTGFDIPPCDLLLIAGDICPDRVGSLWTRHNPENCLFWFNNNIVPWLDPMVKEGKVGNVLFTWGNHDWTDRLKSDEIATFREHLPPKWNLLVDEVEEVGVNVWGTPWSNEFYGWAWMKEPKDLKPIYDSIPTGIDIIMSHQPPKGYGGKCPDGFDAGSIELVETIRRIKPKAVVCGHIHGAHGTYNLDETTVYNVSVVNEKYEIAYPVTEFLL
jgi:Icc-related predicted phosphoesterase